MKKEVSEVAKKLKILRERAGLSIREVSEKLSFATPSGYQHYEDKYKKTYLPKELVDNLLPILSVRGIPEAAILELGGFTAGVQEPGGGVFHYALPPKRAMLSWESAPEPALNHKLHTKAVLIAKDALEEWGGQADEEAIGALASEMCKMAGLRGTEVITIELAKWLLTVKDSANN